MSPLARTFITVLAVVLVAVVLSLIALSCASDIFGLNKPDNQIEVSIKDGMSSWEIANLLEDVGVIEHPLTFRLYSSIKNKKAFFQAGDYILNSQMGYDEIILALKTGNTIKNEVRLTFIEGMSARDIAKLLEKNEVCKASDFLNALDSGDFGFEFEDMLPSDEHRFHKLEGYLFPDTYDFYVGENVNSVIRKFLKNFQDRVFPDVYGEIQDAGMTLDEAITLASVIQKEAGDLKEMRNVSSVFHNRLSNPEAYPTLQSDVTIFYVERDIKPLLTIADQELYDSYNTYVRKGLPVGPICSPGLDAIDAAIHPAKTDYNFFVTDANGKYYYAVTLAEHNKNVRAASSVGEGHGIATQN